MTKVLYVTANPKDASISYSKAVGEAFLHDYKLANPNDEVIELDLYQSYIPQIDPDVFQGWGKLQNGADFTSLSEEEQKKVSRLEALCNQFIEADKYVFVTPLWNFSLPPIMKAYFDAVAVAGKTFKHTEQGAIGLLEGKKALHIQASGGIYSHGPTADIEMGNRYVRTILSFFGINDVEALFVEGHDQMPDKKEEIKQMAIQQAKEYAATF